MPSIAEIVRFLEEFAPPDIAEDWDNVGLLLGDGTLAARRVMTCLTVTEDTVDEAIEEQVNLVVAHHPLPFQPLRRLTTDSRDGALLWRLAGAKVSVYSPHTAFDSATAGINARLAAGLGLTALEPLLPQEHGPGAGRHGTIAPAITLGALASAVKTFLAIERVQVVGDLQRSVSRVGVACGSGGDFLAAADTAGCDCLVTGEARFHTSLEAESRGIGLILAGHYATERFGVEQLADVLRERCADIEVWASRRERDPHVWA